MARSSASAGIPFQAWRCFAERRRWHMDCEQGADGVGCADSQREVNLAAALVNSVEIDRSPADVLTYVTDPAHFTEWQDAVVSAYVQGSGPIQLGLRLTMTRKVMSTRTQTMTSELTAHNPPEAYAFRVIDGPVRAIGKGSFAPLKGERARALRSSSTSKGTAWASSSAPWWCVGRQQKSLSAATKR